MLLFGLLHFAHWYGSWHCCSILISHNKLLLLLHHTAKSSLSFNFCLSLYISSTVSNSLHLSCLSISQSSPSRLSAYPSYPIQHSIFSTITRVLTTSPSDSTQGRYHTLHMVHSWHQLQGSPSVPQPRCPVCCTSVDDQAIAGVCVADLAATQEEVPDVQRVLPAVPLQAPHEMMHPAVGFLASHCTCGDPVSSSHITDLALVVGMHLPATFLRPQLRPPYQAQHHLSAPSERP